LPAFGLAGFFSKDEILWRAYQASGLTRLVGLITAFITSFYMFRLWFMTFFGEYRGRGRERERSWQVIALTMHMGSTGMAGFTRAEVMVIPLAILAVLSVVGGYVGSAGIAGPQIIASTVSGRWFHGSAPAWQDTAWAKKVRQKKRPRTGAEERVRLN